LIQTQNEDLTVSLVEAKKNEEMQTRAGSVAERIMNRLQTSEGWMSRSDLNSDPLVGGSVAAVQKTLQRLENRGVLEVSKKSNESGGQAVKLYRSLRVRTCGESQTSGQVHQNPVQNKISGVDTMPESEQCPPLKSSPGAPSQQAWTLSTNPHARTEEELNSTLDQSVWD
jgi:ribosomal protein S25